MSFDNSILIKAIDDMFKALYMHLNAYLEYIFNAPSTINRIIKYYAIGFNQDKLDEVYIMFNGVVVKTYVKNIPKVNYKEVSICFGQ